jgi:hypothetical protein
MAAVLSVRHPSWQHSRRTLLLLERVIRKEYPTRYCMCAASTVTGLRNVRFQDAAVAALAVGSLGVQACYWVQLQTMVLP